MMENHVIPFASYRIDTTRSITLHGRLPVGLAGKRNTLGTDEIPVDV
jgi:hypothetical protein